VSKRPIKTIYYDWHLSAESVNFVLGDLRAERHLLEQIEALHELRPDDFQLKIIDPGLRCKLIPLRQKYY
jgi:hypothetical protein